MSDTTHAPVTLDASDFTVEGSSIVANDKLYTEKLAGHTDLTQAQVANLEAFNRGFIAETVRVTGEIAQDKMAEDDTLRELTGIAKLYGRGKVEIHHKHSSEQRLPRTGEVKTIYGQSTIKVTNSWGSPKSGAIGTARDALKAAAEKRFG